MLDYKIKELNHQIEPREKEIAVLMKQIKEMDSELEEYHRMNNSLELKASEFKQRLRSAEQECSNESKRVQNLAALYKKFQDEIGDCIFHVQSPRAFKVHLYSSGKS